MSSSSGSRVALNICAARYACVGVLEDGASALSYFSVCGDSDNIDALGSAPRAVGGACGANPFPIISPCHRVISKSQDFNAGLGGFARAGSDGLYLDIKRWLLAHEKKHA